MDTVKISDLFFGNTELVKRLARVSQKKAELMISDLWRTLWVMGIIWAAATVLGAYAPHGSSLKDFLIILGLIAAVPHTVGIAYRVLPAYAILSVLFRVAPKGNQDAIAGIPSDLKVAMKDLAWLLMSEIGTGILVWVIPFSALPGFTHWILIAALGTMFYSISEGTGKWWRFTMKYATMGVMLVLVGLTIISTSPWLNAKVGGVGSWWSAKPDENQGGSDNKKVEDFQILSGDTVRVPYGKDFVIAQGAKKMTFIFRPEGFTLERGAITIESSTPIRWIDGSVKSQVEVDAQEWVQRFGGTLCMSGKPNFEDKVASKPLVYTISAPRGDAYIVAKREGEDCSFASNLRF